MFQWLDSISESCDEKQEVQTLEYKTKTEMACALLKQYLVKGDMASKEIYERLGEAGISRRTIAETKHVLGIQSYRIEFEGESLYVFDLVAAEVFHERKKKQSDEVMPTETSAENKEEAQPVNTRKGYYPDDIAGSFGVPVEQHRQESEVRQMDGYVSVGMLTGLPGQQQNT